MKISAKKAISALAGWLILWGAALSAEAQPGTFAVSGRVTDTGGSAIVGATIVVEKTSNGTTTGSDGSYRITVREGDLLRFSFMGCASQEFTASAARTHLDVVLAEDAQQIGDVVVIGYGTVQKKDLTGSIESLSGTEIAKAMTVNPTDALNGRVSGVLVTKASNRPGADMSIQIRGLNSFNYSNEPLYVIDGVPSSSGMRHINPEDIESIDILKDASSCAIYGSRGANGVVIVTTKGVNNKEGFTIEYSGYAGVKTPTRIPDMLGSKGNGMEYVDFRIKQWTNKFGASSLSTDAFLTPDERRHIKHGEYYDWLREFSKEAVTTNHSLSASGSTASTSYTFGVGYMQDGGLAGSENFERLTANIGLEYRLREKARMGMRAYMSHNKIDHGSEDALLNAYYITPIVGRYGPDGTPTFSHRPGGRVNPFVQDANTTNQSDGWSYNVSAYLSYMPVENLTLKTQFAAQYDGAVNGYWTGTDSQYGQGVKNPYATRSEGYNQNWVWDNTVTYENTFRDQHKLSVIALFSMQKDKHTGSGMTGEGLPYESDWHAIQTAEQITNVNSSYWESAMVSVMGRVNYVFRDKYLFTVTARYDGTSRLARKNRWGLLPSAAVGWSVKNENFLRDKEWLNTLKLRLSWGKTGNNNIGHNVTRTQLGLSPYMLGGTGIKGFGMGGSLGNEDLKWEMTSEWNAGLDFGFLSNRLTGAVDVYFRKTTDLIFQRQVAELNGFNSLLQNIGTTQNRGVEFSLNSVNVDKRNFKWKTNLVFSLNRNKILDLDGTKTDDLANRRFIGKPMNVYYDVKQAGIWQEWEKDEAAKYSAAPGWPKIEDHHPDGVIDAKDMYILGTQSPDCTAGMTNTFSYKNWDLSVYMYAQFGGLYNDPFTYYFLGLNNQDWNKLSVPYWTPENRNDKYPGIGLDCLWTQVLSQVDGTFLKIQNITLGYSLPASALNKVRMKGLRVYLSVQNPFTFSDYLGSDPQVIGEDLSRQLSLYPLTFTCGVNLKF